MAIKPSPSNSTSNPAHPLTFPALAFAKLAPTTFLTAHLSSPQGPLRPSGRSPSQVRTPTCHTGSLTHAHGSAVVRCGDTAVVCGVRGEVLRVEDIPDYKYRPEEDPRRDDEDEQGRYKRMRREDSEEMAQLGLLVPNLELATGCSPDNLPGGPPSPLAQTLTQRILTLLHTTHLLSMSDLRIWFHPQAPSSTPSQIEEDDEDLARPSVKAFWTLYIDILFISLDGNAFDAAWLSVLAALKDTRLPRAWWDGDREMVLCSDDPDEARVLKLYNMPVALSFGVFEGDGEEKGKRWVLVDMDGFEEGLCRESGTVVVGDGGRVVRIEKSGGGIAGVKEVRGLVQVAMGRRREWIGLLG